MTTATWNTVVDHSSDAGFRAWGSELSAKLAAIGLIQTADTGQVNWSTVTRPGTNTAGGYEIWKFSDSSLYLKIEYGTAGTATIPSMWITVGTGSNGSGTITGQTSTRSSFTRNSTLASTSTAYTSYICHNTNAFSLVWKMNSDSNTYPGAMLVIGKTVDGSGTVTTVGFSVVRSNAGNCSFQSVRTTSVATTYNDSVTGWVCFPGLPASSLSESNYQCYECFGNYPDVQPWPWVNGIVTADIPKLTTYTVAMVASVNHTYLALGTLAQGPAGFSAITYSIGVIWE